MPGFNRNTAQQLASNLRVTPLRFSNIRGDGQSRWDLSAIKAFRLTEGWTMQFRAECLNAWNHPNLCAEHDADQHGFRHHHSARMCRAPGSFRSSWRFEEPVS